MIGEWTWHLWSWVDFGNTYTLCDREKENYLCSELGTETTGNSMKFDFE